MIAFHPLTNEPVFSWFGGSREGATDVAVYVMEGDKKFVIGDDVNLPAWNPILVPYEDDIVIFMKLGTFCDRWQTFTCRLSEIKVPTGISYKEMNVIPAGLNGPVKSAPIFVDGDLVCGSSVETQLDWTSYIEVYRMDGYKPAFKFRSDPLTVEKKEYERIHSFTGRPVSARTMGVIQPTLWCRDGTITAFMRSSRGLGNIYVCHGFIEHDRAAFTQPKATAFPNPNSAVDVVYFEDEDRLFLIYNPDKELRAPLVISEIKMGHPANPVYEIVDTMVIRDEVPEDEPTMTNELSYPYAIGHEGKIHLTYTYGRSKIEYCVIEV